MPSLSTACINSSVTRTELFAFWKKIELYASESGPDAVIPRLHQVPRLLLFLHLALDKVLNIRMVDIQTPPSSPRAASCHPHLITPANASNPRMKLSGPVAVPPPLSVSIDPRMLLKFEPAPDPHLNSMPSVFASVRIESSESFTELMKQAEHCGFE